MKILKKDSLKKTMRILTVLVIIIQLTIFPARLIAATELNSVILPEENSLREVRDVKETQELRDPQDPTLNADLTIEQTESQIITEPYSDTQNLGALCQNTEMDTSNSNLLSCTPQAFPDEPLTIYNAEINSSNITPTSSDENQTNNLPEEENSVIIESEATQTDPSNLIIMETETTPEVISDETQNSQDIVDSSSTSSTSNTNTGENSSNSVITDNSNTTEINNENNLSLDQTVEVMGDTGQNNVAYINGDTEIISGDINENVNLITMANTNINGNTTPATTVSLDIVGTMEEDIDFNNLELLGLQETNDFLNGSLVNTNENTGFNSKNTTVTIESTNTDIKNFNNADLANDLDITLSTGDNSTQSINGDSTIETGDINMAANVVNFVNSSITTVGNFVIGVIDIFGTLIGDIILPDAPQTTTTTEGTSLLAENNNTGPNSQNTSETKSSSTTSIDNNNDLTLSNDFNISADTGSNGVESINGNTTIDTGNVYVESNTVNIGNSNTVADNTDTTQSFWLVLINNLGTWTGQILGLDSSGNPNDSIIAYQFTDTDLASLNENTGANSINQASSTGSTTNKITNQNEASIDNTIDINASTGGNTFTNNNGNNYLETGDINILANVLNIMNYNFVGGSWGLLVINIFGTWMGDLVGPGYEYPVAIEDNNEIEESIIPDAIPPVIDDKIVDETTNPVEEDTTSETNNTYIPSEKIASNTQSEILSPDQESIKPEDTNTQSNNVVLSQNNNLSYYSNPEMNSPEVIFITANMPLQIGSGTKLDKEIGTDSLQETNSSTIYEVGNNKNSDSPFVDFLKDYSPFALIGIMGIVLKKRVFNP